VRIKSINLFYLFLGLLGFKASPAMASLYLCAPEIQGDVTVTGYADCVDVQSWQWGGGRGISAGGGSVSDLSMSEITITKQTDSSSVDFLNFLVSGNAIPNLELSYDECGECADSVPAVKLTLTGVRISGLSQSSGGAIPSESVSLNFETIQWCYNISPMTKLECVNFDLRKP